MQMKSNFLNTNINENKLFWEPRIETLDFGPKNPKNEIKLFWEPQIETLDFGPKNPKK